MGRTLSLIYGWVNLALLVVGLIITLAFMFPPLLEQLKDAQGADRAGIIGGLVGGIVGAVIGAIYPIILLIFMYRPSIMAWYGGFGPAAGEPWQP